MWPIKKVKSPPPWTKLDVGIVRRERGIPFQKQSTEINGMVKGFQILCSGVTGRIYSGNVQSASHKDHRISLHLGRNCSFHSDLEQLPWVCPTAVCLKLLPGWTWLNSVNSHGSLQNCCPQLVSRLALPSRVQKANDRGLHLGYPAGWIPSQSETTKHSPFYSMDTEQAQSSYLLYCSSCIDFSPL